CSRTPPTRFARTAWRVLRRRVRPVRHDGELHRSPHHPTTMRSSLPVVVAALAIPAIIAAQAAPPTKALQYTRLTLPNGLVAVLNEDHSSPIVGIGVAYHVGAKDEKDGATGLTHVCEHMMFEGSANVAPGDFQAKIKSGGGNSAHWGE